MFRTSTTLRYSHINQVFRFRVLPAIMKLLLRPKKRVRFVRLGTAYGGWFVPTDILKPGNVAYCGGVGEDISFDLALVEHGLVVHAFDPTPRAIEYISVHGPESDHFTFEPIGWWNERAELRFYVPRDPTHVSHSVTNLQRTDEYFVAPVLPVHEIASERNEGTINLIKMDIEGAEFQVVDSLILNGPSADVLCVEFDQPDASLRKTFAAVRSLESAGYILEVIDGWNYTFTTKGRDFESARSA